MRGKPHSTVNEFATNSARAYGDDIPVVSCEVVGIHDGVCTFRVGDVVDDTGQSSFVRCIHSPGHLCWYDAFHQDRDP